VTSSTKPEISLRSILHCRQRTIEPRPQVTGTGHFVKTLHVVFGRLFVKRFALCYRSVVCLSVCLSVCPVCNIRALWPNCWTDQDETWQAGKPRPWPHCVRWGPSSPSPKEAQPPPNFRPISVAAKWLHGSRCHLLWS